MKRVAVGFAIAALAGSVAQAQLFRAPVQLTSTLVNTSFTEYAPSPVNNGLKMYFQSNRVASLAGSNVWSVTRPDLASPWGNLRQESGLNSALNEDYLDARDDDLEFYVASNRTGTLGLNDIWMFQRSSTSVPWMSVTPINIVGVSTANGDDDPTISADGLDLFWVAPETASAAAIYHATRVNNMSTVWSAQGTIVAAASALADHSPAISPDGLTLMWSSTRTGGTGSADYYMCTRPDRTSPFDPNTVAEVTELNTTGWDHNGQWSTDGFSFYFTQNANNEIWRADRILPMNPIDGAIGSAGGLVNVQLGATVTIGCRRDPGDIGVILVGRNRTPPIPLPGVTGQGLEINLGTLIFPPQIGPIGNNGRYNLFPIPIPNNNSLIGFQFHTQVGAQAGTSAYIGGAESVVIIP